MATKWAICGTGKIASDFSTCLKCLPSSEHQIVAVAAGSSKAKAEEFAKRFDIPNSYGSYDDLLKNNDIDVIYVGVIHPFHVELCLKFINACKHVLCEKPMALTLKGCRQVLEAAKAKGVLFVEATWSRFFPAYAFIRNQIDAGNIGDVKMLQANFCLPISDVPRVKDKQMGGGGLLDIGIYTVQAAFFVFREKPEKIWTDGVVCEENGVDKSGVIVLRYKGGRFASLHYNTETHAGNNSLVIRGTKGTIEIPDTFWSPTQVSVGGVLQEFPLPDCQPYSVNFPNSEGLTYEAKEVRRCLQNGLKESPYMSHWDSESIMSVTQEVLDTMGVKYDGL